MSNTRELRQRIKSVGNTAKVTNAMQFIAASKLRKAQEKAESARAYADGINGMYEQVMSSAEISETLFEKVPLSRSRKVKKAAMVLLTPDRGLAGALVSNLVRTAALGIKEATFEYGVVAVGRKGENFVSRMENDLIKSFSVGDVPSAKDVGQIAKHLADLYVEEKIDRVDVVYAKFFSTAIQKPLLKTILPILPVSETASELSSAITKKVAGDPIYEPDTLGLIKALLPKYFETQLYQAVLETTASEHAARMVAMKNATDNAYELIDDLTLELNKARQTGITNELLDIIGGVAALG